MVTRSIRARILAAGAVFVLATIPDASALEVGDAAPELGLEGLLQAPDGTDFSWETLRGQAVVLEFWSTHCGPCISAIPHLNELAQTIREEGESVQFIAITYEEQDVTEAFLDKTPIEGWIGLDTDSSVIEAFDVPGVPHTILVYPDGRIAGTTYPWTLEMVHLRRLAWGRDLELPETPVGMRIQPGLGVGEEGEVTERFELHEAQHAGTSTISSRMDRATAKGVTAQRLVAWAHGFSVSRVEWQGEPPEGVFDLIAAAPGDEQGFRSRVQELVTETFGVAVREENRRMPVYVLKPGRWSDDRLVPSEETHGSSGSFGAHRIQMTNCKMRSLARQLEQRLGRPVLDETGLEGGFDFDLLWNEAFPRAVFRELRTKYGLVVAAEKRDLRLLVVE